MFDAFPFDSWPPPYGDGPEDMAEFWTFGGQGSTGTWILTVVGFAVMLIALYGFVQLESRKLSAQASRLRASGALDRPGAGPTV